MNANEARFLVENSKYSSPNDLQIQIDSIDEQIRLQASRKQSWFVVSKISYGDVISLTRVYKERGFKVTDRCAGDDGERPPQAVYDLIIQW